MKWIKNKPGVRKPSGFVLLWIASPGWPVVGEWNARDDEWETDDTDPFGEKRNRGDGEISHFMVIKEPA